jgi:hypothetical protein
MSNILIKWCVYVFCGLCSKKKKKTELRSICATTVMAVSYTGSKVWPKDISSSKARP